MQPINAKQNRLQHKFGSIKLNMHHTKISRITLRKAASTQSQSQSQPSPTAEYDYNSSTICTTATRKQTSKQCKLNIKSTTQIEQNINNRNMKLMMTIMNSSNDVIIASIVHATITRLMSSNMRKNQRITTSSAWNETKIFPTLRTLLS